MWRGKTTWEDTEVQKENAPFPRQHTHTHKHAHRVIVLFTWPATASPSARSDDANQTCMQIWNAAAGFGPNRPAIAVAKVTQIVAATTLNNSREPVTKNQIKLERRVISSVAQTIIKPATSNMIWRILVVKWHPFVPFLRNRLNCNCPRLGGIRSTSFNSWTKRINDIKYLQITLH